MLRWLLGKESEPAGPSATTRVEIGTGDYQVVVESDTDLDRAAQKALELLHLVGGVQPRTARLLGFGTGRFDEVEPDTQLQHLDVALPGRMPEAEDPYGRR